MPRLREVPRSEISSPRVLEAYQQHFGDRDPVVDPGTVAGTPGTWWTVFALDPELFGMMLDRHLWQSSSSRHLDPLLRELAMTRTGWTSESQFVYSQHRKVLRRLGVADDKIDSVPFWSSASCYSDVERAVLGYADDLVLGGGRVADERFAQLRASLTDVAIFELTYMICTYQMSSVMCRALHLEYDDREDLIVEVVTEHS